MLHFWSFLLVVTILTSACPAFAQTRGETVSHIKLENYGWQPPPEEQRGEWKGTSSKLVSIDHQGRVLVGFTVRENYSLATREHPGHSFHILRFTSEGMVDHSLVLPTNNWLNNGLYLDSEDSIHARANDTFQFLSEQHDAGNAGWVWKALAPCSMDCTIMQSPSRRTLIVIDFQGHVHHTFIVLESSLGVPPAVKDCPWIDSYGQAITDRFVYHSTDGISTDARRWPLCEPEHVTELPLDMRNGAIRPLSDEALLLLGTPTGKKVPLRGVTLVAPDGQVKFQQEMPRHDFVVPYWTAFDERGDRFAFTVETWRGGSTFFDISGKRVARRVVVFTEAGQQIAAIPVSTTYHRDFDFAMSPDGHRLAILDKGVLTVVDLE
jgi:hypothetical protein